MVVQIERTNSLPQQQLYAVMEDAVECRRKPGDTAHAAAAPEVILMRLLPHWNDRSAWSFACDCAEHVLPLFERGYPCDERPRLALQTARRYLAGHATFGELDQAWDAARTAILEIRGDMPWDAGALAGSAAVDAAGGDYQAAVWVAARAAARAPCWSHLWANVWRANRSELGAALATAWETASREERAWQIQRLDTYLTRAVPEPPSTGLLPQQRLMPGFHGRMPHVPE